MHNVIAIISIYVPPVMRYNILDSLDIIPLYPLSNPVIPPGHIYTRQKEIRQYPGKDTAVSPSYLPGHRDKYGLVMWNR